MSKQKPPEMGPYLQLLFKLGLSVCFSILFGFGLGLFLEKKFPKGGLFLLLGIGLGVLMGFVLLFKEIMNLNSLDDAKTYHDDD